MKRVKKERGKSCTLEKHLMDSCAFKTHLTESKIILLCRQNHGISLLQTNFEK